MFLGWYDPDKRTKTIVKVYQAAERYYEKFGVEPDTVLCNTTHEQELDGGDFLVRTVNYIPRNTFYVGMAEDGDAVTLNEDCS